MAGRYGDLNYAFLTKAGVSIGVSLFLVGAGAEFTLRTVADISPSLDAVLVAMELLGPLIAVLSLVVFGVAMPLTE